MAKSENYALNKSNSFRFNDSLVRSWKQVCTAFVVMLGEHPYQPFVELCAEDGIKAEDFNQELVKEFVPTRVNSIGQICSVKKYANEEYKDICELVDSFAKFEHKAYNEYYMLVYEPMWRFTASQVYGLVKTAVANRAKGVAKAKKEAEKEAKAKAETKAESKKSGK